MPRAGDAPAQLQLVQEWTREEHPFVQEQQPWGHVTVVVARSPVVTPTPNHPGGRRATRHQPVTGGAAQVADAPDRLCTLPSSCRRGPHKDGGGARGIASSRQNRIAAERQNRMAAPRHDRAVARWAAWPDGRTAAGL